MMEDDVYTRISAPIRILVCHALGCHSCNPRCNEPLLALVVGDVLLPPRPLASAGQVDADEFAVHDQFSDSRLERCTGFLLQSLALRCMELQVRSTHEHRHAGLKSTGLYSTGTQVVRGAARYPSIGGGG